MEAKLMHDGSDDADANDDLKNPRIALNSFLKKLNFIFEVQYKKIKGKTPPKKLWNKKQIDEEHTMLSKADIPRSCV